MIPDYPTLKAMSGAIKVICHGNSITFGTGASTTAKAYPPVMAGLPPLSGSITVVNSGVAGQSIGTPDISVPSTMRGTLASAVTANLSATAINILVVNEFFNELRVNGLNADAAVQQLWTYCSEARAAADSSGKNLQIVICTTTPGGNDPSGSGQSWVDARAAAIMAANLKLRNGYRQHANYLCDIAGFAPFLEIFENGIFTPAVFAAATDSKGNALWHRSDGVADDYTHFGNFGYELLAQIVSRTMRRLRQLG